MAEEFLHSIKMASRRTGLSPHVIRAWEKRYAAVRPTRTEGNRRLYSSGELERLSLLKKATEAGHSIGDIAGLPTGQLSALVAQESALPGRTESGGVGDAAVGPTPGELVAAAYRAVESMSAEQLEGVLDRASVALGQMRLLNELVVPLVERIGEEWRRGNLKVAHEHIASAVIRTFLGQVARPIAIHPAAPALLVTTPAGQLHELGAVLVAAAATNHGWRVTYAGASLPAEDIASVAQHNRVTAVALSVVHPEDDPSLPTELLRLRRLLPPGVAILAGGRAVGAYRKTLEGLGAVVVTDLIHFTHELDRLRRAGGPR
ncbi:MAG: MerR family transcriptional regulator [Verrucomicrobiota bacterium]